jgi:hypothetical protein
VLTKLASRSQRDVYSIIRMAEQETREGIELEGNYSLEEINEFVVTMRKLLRVRDVVLRVNQQYIRSAAQADEYRTEPAFLLQGSYRNMNRIAEKVLPIMNDQELETLILSSYENDAQTLTSNTESNMLKLKEMLGLSSEEEAARWADIRRTFQQNLKMKGIDTGDHVGQVIVQLREFNDGLYKIREAMSQGVKHLSSQDTPQRDLFLATMLQHVKDLNDNLHSIGAAVKEAAAEAGSIRQEAAAPAEPPPQKVVVRHSVPRSILDVIKSQFDLMNRWLQPISSAADTQSQELTKLQNSVQTCLANYYALMQELESARDKRDA